MRRNVPAAVSLQRGLVPAPPGRVGPEVAELYARSGGDGCAAVRDQDRDATLHVVYGSYGDVIPAYEVLALLESGAGRAAR